MRDWAAGLDAATFPHPTANCRTTASFTIWSNIAGALRLTSSNPYGESITITGCDQDRALIQQTVPVDDADYIAERIPNTAHVGGGILRTAVNKPADKVLVNRRALRRSGGAGAVGGSIDLNGNPIFWTTATTPEISIAGDVNVSLFDASLPGGRLIIGGGGSPGDGHLPYDTPRVVDIANSWASYVRGPDLRPTFFTAPSVTYGSTSGPVVLKLGVTSQVNVDDFVRIEGATHIDMYRDTNEWFGNTTRPTVMYNPVINRPDGTVIDVLDSAPSVFLRSSATVIAPDLTQTRSCPTSASGNPAPIPPTILLSVVARSTTGLLADGTVLPEDGPRYYRAQMWEIDDNPITYAVRAFVTPTPTLDYSACHGSDLVSTGRTCYRDSVTIEAYCPAVF